jgi:methyl-accepting chemotaxis protein
MKVHLFSQKAKVISVWLIALLAMAAWATFAVWLAAPADRWAVGLAGSASWLALAAVGSWAHWGGRAALDPALQAAQRLSAGDLTGTYTAVDPGERGALMRSLKDVHEQMFTVVRNMRTGTTTAATTASQISRDLATLLTRSDEQTTNLDETSTAVAALTDAVKQNAGHADQANTLVASASARATRGGEVVSQVVQTMGSIRESSRKISDIIGVIDGIAFQTNILALNAAVEAARAGEQGRGFAVVASEVRTLAQRSATAAKEIKQLIGASVEKVDAGAKLVDAAGATMGEIVESVRDVAGIMERISHSSRQQNSGIDSVNTSIAQIDTLIRKNAQLVGETTQTAVSLNEQSVALMRTVSKFNLGSREHGTAEEAKAMVERGTAFAREHGTAALVAEINKLGKGQFIDRDLYLMALGANDSLFVAHGSNSRVLGTGNVSKDVDGKLFVEEMRQLANRAGNGWVDYKWAHPVTNEILVKTSFVQKVGELVIACGVYKV